MDKKPFDFKDLMAFGMFILALLTFVFKHRKTTPELWRVGVVIL